ncbi:MAG: HAMP domain-containing protein [Candidatus Aenigmarchaeota archaeon]|nr:HAMP domain-containing protein [Candidatus Aenigmarchaeota archaeon]
MKISVAITLGFLLMASIIGVLGAVAIDQIEAIQRPINEEIPASLRSINETSHLDSTAQFIRYYDEVLTQSARNYAFTGDVGWRDRYDRYSHDLDRAIKSAIDLGDEKDRDLFRKIDQSNLYLVEMETTSMDLVSDGRAEEAISILDSDIYWGNKSVYESGLREYVSRRGFLYDQSIFVSTESLNKISVEERNLISLSTQIILGLVALAVTVSVLLGLYLAGLVSKPLTHLTENLDRISRGDFDVQITESSGIKEIRTLVDSVKRILKTMKLAVLETGDRK